MRNAEFQCMLRAHDISRSIPHREFRISHSNYPLSTLLASLAGLTNAAEPVAGWVTGGQPTEKELSAFKAAGGEVVLDNRDTMEPRGFDEPAVVRKAGLEYISLPIVPCPVTVDTMKRVHDTPRT